MPPGKHAEPQNGMKPFCEDTIGITPLSTSECPRWGGRYNWGSLLGLELTMFHLDHANREAHGELQGEVCDYSEKLVGLEH